MPRKLAQRLDKEANQLRIDGYDDTDTLAKVSNPLGRRLSGLRRHQQVLETAKEAIDNSDGQTMNEALAEALVVGVAAMYFSCFAGSTAVGELQPSRVFSGQSDLRREFDHWKDIRDKHLIHDSSEWTSCQTGVAYDAGGEVIDVVSMHARANPTHMPDELKSLKRLVEHTLKFVTAEATSCARRIFEDIAALAPESRPKTPLQYIVPGPNSVSRDRAGRSNASQPTTEEANATSPALTVSIWSTNPP
jgi:hypothetical protein